MSDTKITLTNMPKGREKATTLHCGTMTVQQKQEFLDCIFKYNPKSNNGHNHTCGFNLYYDKRALRVVSYDTPKQYKPLRHKNSENELVIEIIPLHHEECGSWANYHCPMCLEYGACTSQFIRKYIGEVLFPDKYGRNR